MGQSIIDYVKEDTSHVSEGISVYVAEDRANYIARINNANNLYFKDITFKATTKRDLGNFLIYAGAVWGIIFDTFATLTFDNIEVSHFAYRGMSTMRTGQNSSNTLNKNVKMKNCYGHDNSGSGFWIKELQKLETIGGEFSYNGVEGDRSSGYAFTASSYVDEVFVKGCYVHNNYSNGIDMHSCYNYIIDNCIFVDNVNRDISSHCWNNYNINKNINISNCEIHKGDTVYGEEWLRNMLSLAISRGNENLTNAVITTINIDDNNNLIFTDKIKNININNVNIYGMYSGLDVCESSYKNAIHIAAHTATLKISNCNWNFDKWITSLTALSP
jgi:hypothetical protein